MFERTVEIDAPWGSTQVAKYATKSSRKAKRMGWKPGTTHVQYVGKFRYVFHDGWTKAAPCLTATII